MSWLPLSKVVPDAEPGGPLLSNLNAINEFANKMHERRYNKVKADWANTTIPAEAASKLAYANFMAPQFVAKFMQNPVLMAQLSDAQKNTLRDLVTSAATNPINQGLNSNKARGNSLNQMPTQMRSSGISSQPSTNNFSGGIKNMLNSLFSVFKPRTMNQNQPMAQNQMAALAQNQERPQSAAPMNDEQSNAANESQTGAQDLNVQEEEKEKAYNDAVLALAQTPEGKAKIDSGLIPDRDSAINWNDAIKNGKTPPPIEYIGAQEEVDPETNKPMKLTVREGQKAPERELTWDEKAGRSAGIQAEGKEAGTIRAQSQKELDQEYTQALQLKTPLTNLREIIKNPIFQNARKLPGFKGTQTDLTSFLGTKAEKEIIGKFTANVQQLVANTVKGFGGRILASEIPLSESMKINKHEDTDVMLGKLPVLEEFNELTLQRAKVASELIEKYHINKGKALVQANELINGDAIREKIQKEFEALPKYNQHPVTEKTIQSTMKLRKMTRGQVIERLRKEGRYNG